jgi:hypothetical protein
VVTIQHASVYADDPKRAADALAAICGGRAAPFSPLPGAWVCFFPGGGFLELYPRTARLKDLGDDVGFEPLPAPATGAGTHFNLRLHRAREDVEKACAALGIKCAQRPGLGFLDVWIEERLLVECVCAG